MSGDSGVSARLAAVRGVLRAAFAEPGGEPWIVAYSGGKYSTLLLQLVWEIAIAGLGKAARLAASRRGRDAAHARNLERRFLDRLRGVEQVFVHGDSAQCVPGIVKPAFRRRRERSADDGAPGPRLLDRLGLHVGARRSVPRAACDGPRRRRGPRRAAFQLRPVHHRRRDRLRGAPDPRGGRRAARALPGLAGFLLRIRIPGGRPGGSSRMNAPAASGSSAGWPRERTGLRSTGGSA